MTMYTNESPDKLIERLRESLVDIHEALDHGVSFAQLQDADFSDDPHFRAHCIRIAARKHLERAQGLQKNWRLSGSSSNSSIQVTVGNIVLRVHLAQDGQPPGSGHSISRRDFYRQAVLPLESGAGRITNLLLHYQVTSEQELVIHICQPIRDWGIGDPAELAWSRQIDIEELADGSLSFQPTESDDEIDLGERDEVDDTG